MRRFICRPGIMLLLASLGALFATPSHAQSAEPLWHDEFDQAGQPNPQYWSYDEGGGGWGNNEAQTYTRDLSNVEVSEGSLHITALQHEEKGKRKSYTSARIKTESKLTIKYGTIEARIKIPDLANGLWPAFWTLGKNIPDVGWPASGEIDVMEMGSAAAIAQGVVNRRVGSHAHWQQDGNYAGYGETLDAFDDLNAEFHLLRMEWTPSSIITYLDDNPIWAMDISAEGCADCSAFHQPHFLILNLAVGGNYTGLYGWRDITATFPAVLEVDYVRVYDNGHTQLGGSAIPGTNTHVEAINVSVSGRKRTSAVAQVLVHDEKGDPVLGAGVSVRFSGSHSGDFTATTDSEGWAQVKTGSNNLEPIFEACVTHIEHSAMTYDSYSNELNCNTY